MVKLKTATAPGLYAPPCPRTRRHVRAQRFLRKRSRLQPLSKQPAEPLRCLFWAWGRGIGASHL